MNTKGGVGKSTVSIMLLPILYFIYYMRSLHINIYEIDNNNKTELLNSELVTFKTLTVKDADHAMDEIDFSLLTDNDSINIVDAGGGDDSKVVLESIAKSDLYGLTYVIPMNDDMEQIENVLSTISLIKESDKRAEIFIILNRINSMEETDIKEQFIGVFGSKKYGIKSRLSELSEGVTAIKFLPNSPLFGIVKNQYKMTLLESYISAIDILENISELKKEWAKESPEIFNANKARYRFAKDIVKLVEEMKSLSDIVHES